MRIEGLSLGSGAAELPWRPTRDPGVQWIPLWTEEAAAGAGGRRGGAVVLIRMAPGRGYAPHRHVGTEDVLVLSGGYRDAAGEHRTGDHVHYPAGSAHAPVALGDPHLPEGEGNPACVLYACVPEGIELLRAAE